jgi:hypothetical protein
MISIKEIVAYAKNYWVSGGWVAISYNPMRTKILGEEYIMDRYVKMLRSPDNNKVIKQAFNSGYEVIIMQEKG